MIVTAGCTTTSFENEITTNRYIAMHHFHWGTSLQVNLIAEGSMDAALKNSKSGTYREAVQQN